MSVWLMIVESPSKAKTIQRYVGKEYRVMATSGHVRELVPKKGAVLVKSDHVQMKYQMIAKNKHHVEALCEQAAKAEHIILATDPDREGEAIAYHLLELFKENIDLKGKTIKRVVFYEITPKEISQGLSEPRDLDLNLVNAQQARRALDYLVGFGLSPVLWKKVKSGLSAGRVQSPALRLIADREEEIAAFSQREYWSIHAILSHKRDKIESKLFSIQGKKVGQFDWNKKEPVDKLMADIITHAQNQWVAQSILKKSRKRQPAPPFTTSTLQQEAARKLGFSSAQTMKIAQQLYEGIDLAGEFTALITYMRTDSVVLSQDAISAIRSQIYSHYGEDFLPSTPRNYKTKSKNAQEAHEAVRPTDCEREPGKIRHHLSPEQAKLYQLIWARTLSSQMSDAIYEDQIVSIIAGSDYVFESRRSFLKREGFLVLYQEGDDDEKKSTMDRKLFDFQEGDSLKLTEFKPEQHFTEPPPRFNEASLIKALDAFGIGRPSTYSSIISTLKTRDYVQLRQKRFYPSDVGSTVNNFLKKFFATYVDYDFTAQMENQLDEIALGKVAWPKLVGDFWKPFHDQLSHVSEKVTKKEAIHEEIGEDCPLCSQVLVKKLGRSGRFIGCSNYPECSYTRPLEGSPEPVKTVDRDCPSCFKPLVYKKGRFGIFIGCSGYPDCRHIESTQAKIETGLICPTCEKGHIFGKKSRKGTVFFACNQYPDCKQTYSAFPIKKNCPVCAAPVMLKKELKKTGKILICAVKTCGHKMPDSSP